MIPARLGSTRVFNKNLRLIDGKPLIQYILAAAKESKLINEIYINSESEIFKEIALNENVRFYKRPMHLSSNEATNDDFALDFMQHINGDLLIQLLPTSPFITSRTIDSFINKILKEELDTCVSVSNAQIECIYKNKSINFDLQKKTPPSQELEPIKVYACGIMGWKYDNYIDNMKKYAAAYHGGDGKIGYYDLKGNEIIDIDNEEDFQLAEAVVLSITKGSKKPSYFNDKNQLVADADRERILNEDGVKDNSLFDFNKEIVTVNKILEKKPTNISWSHTLINSSSNCVTLIAQMPGEGNRRHHHPEWDEWWYIVKGEWIWNIEGEERKVKEGDIVFIERNRIHKITASGKDIAIRLAVSRADVDHVYEKEDYLERR